MSKLDLIILSTDEIAKTDETGTGMTAELHAKKSNIEKLAEAWPEVMNKLRVILERDDNKLTKSGFGVDTVEFSIGIEGGVNIGFTSTMNASATITFKKVVTIQHPQLS